MKAKEKKNIKKEKKQLSMGDIFDTVINHLGAAQETILENNFTHSFFFHLSFPNNFSLEIWGISRHCAGHYNGLQRMLILTKWQ